MARSSVASSGIVALRVWQLRRCYRGCTRRRNCLCTSSSPRSSWAAKRREGALGLQTLTSARHAMPCQRLLADTPTLRQVRDRIVQNSSVWPLTLRSRLRGPAPLWNGKYGSWLPSARRRPWLLYSKPITTHRQYKIFQERHWGAPCDLSEGPRCCVRGRYP